MASQQVTELAFTITNQKVSVRRTMGFAKQIENHESEAISWTPVLHREIKTYCKKNETISCIFRGVIIM